MSDWQTDIGLEIHVQLHTRTKLFCGDEAAFGAPPNTHVCPVCMGLPGALPITSAGAVALAVRTALGLGCTVHETSLFARKNYFYPDLPKGYQITQFEQPLATGGRVDYRPDRSGDAIATVRIRRVHIEEDAGKSLHDRFAGMTAVDLNRAGVPLVEIVTEPDLHSPAAARAFLDRLKQTLRYLDVSDCDMEKGSLRVDANVSVRRPASAVLGTKTELKNMNSFANLEAALDYEVRRQLGVVAGGGAVIHETLLWDESRGEVRSMRSKEESRDYRYFPEPDLPPLVVTAAEIEQIARDLPELPGAKEMRLGSEYSLPAYDVGVLAADPAVADYFEAVATSAGDGKSASNWVMTDVLGWLNQRGLHVSEMPVSPARLAGLIALVRAGTISASVARRVFQLMAEGDASAAELVELHGLTQVRDEAQLEAWVDEAVAGHPDEAARYRGGETKLLGFLMGQIMQRSGGKADPRRASDLLRRRLDAD
ncbi:MAG TPA: Asp-tRNA(Asn)/Glu-tRNA(Gln) amidotransferase subunit GatB [Longimicrobiales bacterium]|nr:Asp-tRNA(Asn)/Glu-tRNA(Gln) amidotransferase subunit GatB [Longimicrobiales bacterium]